VAGHLLALLRSSLLDLEVAVDDTKYVEGLALVLVKTLNLAREVGVDVNRDPQLALENIRKLSG
jgi:hypothetical protein